MPDFAIDLLPPERRRAWRRRYFMRLGVVASYIGVALAVTAGILLVPTLVFLERAGAQAQAQLVAIESALSSYDEVQLAGRLASLSTDATVLLGLSNTPPVLGIFRKALAAPRPGITLSEFSYAAGAQSKRGILILTGVASTRNALRAYQLALAAIPGFTSADLPVSTYAKESSIPFTITVMLASPSSTS